MMLARRRFLGVAGGALAAPALARRGYAQAYPSRPVRIVVPIAPGGGLDLPARLMAQWLSDRLGQSFVVDNRPGGGGNIGTEVVVRAAPDGYTLLLAAFQNVVNLSLYPKLSFNFMRDIAAVAGLNISPHVLVVNPSVPARSVPELIAYAKAHPNKLNLASPGNGTPGHVGGELFKMEAGIAMTHVPYRGGSLALPDLLSGQVQAMVLSTSAVIELIKTGKLRALAATTARRIPLMPDVPAMAEFMPGFEANGWTGFGVPAGTPPEIIDRLSKEIGVGLAQSSITQRLAELGGIPMPMTAEAFGRFLVSEAEKWAKVVKFAKLKPA